MIICFVIRAVYNHSDTRLPGWFLNDSKWYIPGLFFSRSCSYSKICRKHLLTGRISLFCLHLGKPTTSSSEACRFCGSRSGTELSAVGSVCSDADCQVRVSVAPHSKEQLTCVSLRTPLLGLSEGLSSESLSFSELAHYPCQELAVSAKLENSEIKALKPEPTLVVSQPSPLCVFNTFFSAGSR